MCPFFDSGSGIERAELYLYPGIFPDAVAFVMKRENIQELKIMEEVDRSDGIATQREIALKLDISLGLVNSFVKRIVRKGYFKVTTIPGRRVRYLLTPKGIAEKSRLTTEYLRYSLSYYSEIRRRLMDFAEELDNQGVGSVALVGTGELVELFTLALRQAKIEMSHIFSEDNSNGWFLGYPVESFKAIENGTFDKICLVGLDNVPAVRERLEQLGVGDGRIVVCPDL